MTAYNWEKIMDMKTDSELQEIANYNPERLESEAILAAEIEIKKRTENQSFNKEPEFPEKPIPDEKSHSIKKSLTSLILFVAAFYFIFRWDLKYIFILTGIILIHELGHFLAMRQFKYKDLSIFFIPLVGALASGQKDEISQKQMTLISLAGPLPGVIIGSIFIGYGLVTKDDFLYTTGEIFILLNLFNLLPILPLDGGQIIKNLFFHQNEKINIIFMWISLALISFIALKLESFLLLIIPFFLFIQIRYQSQIKKFKTHIKEQGFNINRDFKELSNKEYWLIRDEIAVNFQGLTNLIEPKRYYTIPAEDRVINVMRQVVQKEPIKDIKIGGKIMVLLLLVLTFLIPIITVGVLYFNGLIEL
jgi:stage IV sporulation protein FB